MSVRLRLVNVFVSLIILFDIRLSNRLSKYNEIREMTFEKLPKTIMIRDRQFW